MNTKKITTNILYNNYTLFLYFLKLHFISFGSNLTFFSNNKILEKNNIKNIYNKFSKKKNNNKYNKIISVNNKKPDTHRNYYY